MSYSTCSIYEEEDEKVVARALAELNKETKTWSIATVKSSLPSHGHVIPYFILMMYRKLMVYQKKKQVMLFDVKWVMD